MKKRHFSSMGAATAYQKEKENFVGVRNSRRFQRSVWNFLLSRQDTGSARYAAFYCNNLILYTCTSTHPLAECLDWTLRLFSLRWRIRLRNLLNKYHLRLLWLSLCFWCVYDIFSLFSVQFLHRKSVCYSVGRIIGSDIGNFHTQWGAVMKFSQRITREEASK